MQTARDDGSSEAPRPLQVHDEEQEEADQRGKVFDQGK